MSPVQQSTARKAKAPKAKPVPPGATSTTTPAGIRRFDPDVVLDSNLPPESEAVDLPIDKLERHPLNRIPKPEDVAKRAASIAELGQLEDVVVRPIAGGRYQLLSGETRWLACKSLKRATIRARMRECSDAMAVRLLAEYNAQREDLDTIEKARMIQHLSAPEADGGGGMTRAEAGRVYGLESHSAASNLVRLLELPALWQDRVVSGEVPQSVARLIVPYVAFAPLMKAIDRSFKDGHRWRTREDAETAVAYVVRENTREMDPKRKRHYSPSGLPYPAWGEYGRLFDVDAELRAKLEVVSMEAKAKGKAAEGTAVEVALNVKLFDELQHKAIKKDYEAKQARKSKKAAGEADKPKTRAELEQSKKQRAEQLARNVKEWRIDLMRQAIAAELQAQDEAGGPLSAVALRLLLLLACDSDAWPGYGGAWDCLTAVGLAEGDREPWERRGSVWARLGEAGDVAELATFEQLARRILAVAIVGNPAEEGAKDTDGNFDALAFDDETIEAIFSAFGLKFADVWRGIQTPAKLPAFEAFFDLFRKDELQPLGAEYEVHLADGLSKAQRVKLLVTRDRLLALPKMLGEFATKKGAKRR